MYVQLSDFAEGGHSRSARHETYRPVRNDIRTACTATGTSADKDGVEAMAAAAKRPEHKPTKNVWSCQVTSSQFFSAWLFY
jgi:hypothetical protein